MIYIYIKFLVFVARHQAYSMWAWCLANYNFFLPDGCFVDGYLIRKWWVSYNYNYFVNCSLSLSPVHSLFVLSYSLLSVAEREHCLIFFHFFSPLHIAAMMFAFGICFRKMRFFLLSSCDSLIPKKKKKSNV
jgi:hypothetical protein